MHTQLGASGPSHSRWRLALAGCNFIPIYSPAEAKRQAKHLVTPQFPDLAKKLHPYGAVCIEVTILAPMAS